MKLFLIAIILAVLPSAACAAPEDAQQWSTLSVSAKLSPHWSVSGEAQARLTDDVSRVGTTVERVSLGYRASERLTLAFGYTHNASLPLGRAVTLENNLFQQVNWTIGKLGHVTVKARTWVEERQFVHFHDTGVRARERLRFELPLRAKGPVLVLSDEQFFALNSTDWGAHAGFDQMRNFIGVNLRVAKGVTVEAGYMNRYLKRNAVADRIDHIVPVTVAIRL